MRTAMQVSYFVPRSGPDRVQSISAVLLDSSLKTTLRRAICCSVLANADRGYARRDR